MREFTIEVEWYTRDNLTAESVAGQLSAIRNGLPGLRSSSVSDIQALRFTCAFLPTGREHAERICVWLADHGVQRSWIIVDSQPILDFFICQLVALRPVIVDTIRREKSRRRWHPNTKDRLHRLQLEEALESLRALVGVPA